MLTVSATAAALIALFCGGWFALALWLSVRARVRLSSAAQTAAEAEGARSLLAASPAIALLATPDGRVEGSDRLASVLGFAGMPETLRGLSNGEAGLEPEDAEALEAQVRACASTGGSFTLLVRLQAFSRAFRVHGQPA